MSNETYVNLQPTLPGWEPVKDERRLIALNYHILQLLLLAPDSLISNDQAQWADLEEEIRQSSGPHTVHYDIDIDMLEPRMMIVSHEDALQILERHLQDDDEQAYLPYPPTQGFLEDL